MIKQKLLLLLVCMAVTLGMACSPATPPPHPQKAVQPASKVLSAPASKETQAALGITRWHMIIESGNNVVIDGANAKGQVKFSSLIHQDSHAMRIESYGQRGTLTIDKDSGTLGTHTLPDDWAAHATAFSADWQKFHEKAAYSFLGDSAKYLGIGAAIAGGVSTVAKGVAIIAAVVPGGQPVAAIAATVSTVAYGTSKVLGGLAVIAVAADQAVPAANAAEKPATTGAENPATPGTENPATPGTDPAAPGTENPATPGNENPATPGNEPGPASGGVGNNEPATDTGGVGSAGQGDPLPAGNTDSNLDSSGGGLDTSGGATSSGAPSGGDTGGGDTGGGATGGGDTGGGATGGGDTGGGDTGGGAAGGGDSSGGEYGAHATCRAVSCSKSLKACICKRY